MKFNTANILSSLKHIAGQKFTWFAIAMVSLTATAFNTRPDDHPGHAMAEDELEMETPERIPVSNTDVVSIAAEETPVTEAALPEVARTKAELSLEEKPVSLASAATKHRAPARKALALTDYAHTLMGTPYIYGGTSKKGFDCSGFIHHVFSKFDVDLERSSRMQGTQGIEISQDEVQQGDLLFFTGTNPNIREVGHVGIVISAPGEPVTFIHSSSNGGVKISELEGYYTTRYMFAKRML
jgi:cell wall-associated NlpC family hydrolase